MSATASAADGVRVVAVRADGTVGVVAVAMDAGNGQLQARLLQLRLWMQSWMRLRRVRLLLARARLAKALRVPMAADVGAVAGDGVADVAVSRGRWSRRVVRLAARRRVTMLRWMSRCMRRPMRRMSWLRRP